MWLSAPLENDVITAMLSSLDPDEKVRHLAKQGSLQSTDRALIIVQSYYAGNVY